MIKILFDGFTQLNIFFPMNVIEVGKPDVKVQLVGCETLCQYKSHLFPFWCRINHKSHAP